MNLRPLLLSVLLASAPLVHAGELYKCEGEKGAITISSEKCPPGSKQIWKRDATPDAPLTPEQQAQDAAKRAEDRENARALSIMAGTSAPPPTAPPPAASASVPAAPVIEGPCRKAHALADGIRANPWLDMRDDQMRRLDAWVAAQCADPSQ